MSKINEQQYFGAIGERGRQHSLLKPFSDEGCDRMLVGIGAIFHLLPPAPAEVLDLGCGTGWTSLFLAQRGYDVAGLDISEEAIQLARDFANDKTFAGTLKFVSGDYETLDTAQKFDAVLFYDSLHHAEDEKAAIACAFRVLKPGGILITHEPGEGHAVNPASVWAMNEFGVTEKDMPPHKILQYGMEIGFTKSKIYPLPATILSAFYDPLMIKKLQQKRKVGLFANISRYFRLVRNNSIYEMAFPSDCESNIVVMIK